MMLTHVLKSPGVTYCGRRAGTPHGTIYPGVKAARADTVRKLDPGKVCYVCNQAMKNTLGQPTSGSESDE